MKPSCGNRLKRERRATHNTGALAASLRQVVATRDEAPQLVFGTSAVIDDADLIPQAIRETGGHVLRVGMPVDPGNLMVLGQIGTCHVLGAPGCANSPERLRLDIGAHSGG